MARRRKNSTTPSDLESAFTSDFVVLTTRKRKVAKRRARKFPKTEQ